MVAADAAVNLLCFGSELTSSLKAPSKTRAVTSWRSGRYIEPDIQRRLPVSWGSTGIISVNLSNLEYFNVISAKPAPCVCCQHELLRFAHALKKRNSLRSCFKYPSACFCRGAKYRQLPHKTERTIIHPKATSMFIVWQGFPFGCWARPYIYNSR